MNNEDVETSKLNYALNTLRTGVRYIHTSISA